MDEKPTTTDNTNDETDGKKKPTPPKKEKPTISWKDSEYAGRTVFAPKGKGTIKKEGEADGRKYFLVDVDGEEIQYSEKSVRFKAIDDKYREHYNVDRTVRTESGAASIDLNDELAQAMRGTSHDQKEAIAKENDLADEFKSWVDSGKNKGMCSMNLRNKLRAKIEGGGKVTILGKTVAQAIKDREKEAEAALKEREAKKAKAEEERLAKQKAKAEKQKVADAAKEVKKQEAAAKAKKAKADDKGKKAA